MPVPPTLQCRYPQILWYWKSLKALRLVGRGVEGGCLDPRLLPNNGKCRFNYVAICCDARRGHFKGRYAYSHFADEDSRERPCLALVEGEYISGLPSSLSQAKERIFVAMSSSNHLTQHGLNATMPKRYQMTKDGILIQERPWIYRNSVQEELMIARQRYKAGEISLSILNEVSARWFQEQRVNNARSNDIKDRMSAGEFTYYDFQKARGYTDEETAMLQELHCQEMLIELSSSGRAESGRVHRNRGQA
ncbi:hypothetical protein EVG20_g4442 [Dentipellis fragilis]|uniref:Uncharacterized protein n=1 Tax=Dentipellis fragilis TaxID=205917 RepID=A0A4Y9YVP1_9AGAM|nr:hypothetical protein EVG20_g4442 [Dentipellis fragilis]